MIIIYSIRNVQFNIPTIIFHNLSNFLFFFHAHCTKEVYRSFRPWRFQDISRCWPTWAFLWPPPHKNIKIDQSRKYHLTRFFLPFNTNQDPSDQRIKWHLPTYLQDSFSFRYAPWYRCIVANSLDIFIIEMLETRILLKWGGLTLYIFSFVLVCLDLWGALQNAWGAWRVIGGTRSKPPRKQNVFSGHDFFT